MKYIKVSEAAAKWGISARRVRLLCEQGRIAGVERKGNLYMIPIFVVLGIKHIPQLRLSLGCGFVTYALSPPPTVPVQTAEVDGFAQMFGRDGGTASEVGDGACHLEDTVVGACGEPQTVHRLLHQRLAPFVDSAVLVEQFRIDLCVAMDVGAVPVAFGLDVAGADHPLAHSGAAFSLCFGQEFVVAQGLDLHVQVDAVEQGAGDTAEVLLHHAGGTSARNFRVIVVSARARIHGGNLQCPLDIFLSFDIGKVKFVVVQTFLELFTDVDSGRHNGHSFVEKVNHLLGTETVIPRQ